MALQDPAGHFEPDDLGSYGLNHWLNDLDSESSNGVLRNGWRGRPDWHWKKPDVSANGRVPVFADCAWYDGNPESLATTNNAAGGAINPTATWNADSPQDWGRDMGRFQMLRHADRGINMAFDDGSGSFVGLNELWSFKWHREFELIDDVDIPW